MNNAVSETSLSGDILRYIRYQLRGRRGLIVAAIALGVPALWFSWPWLVVAGIAPILIAFAPCAIMCAVGLCTMRSCSTSPGDQSGSRSASQAGEETVASVTASRLADETAETLAMAASSQANPDPVEDDSELQPEIAGQSGEPINQEKEKLQ